MQNSGTIVFEDGRRAVVKYAKDSIAASQTDDSIVAAVTGKKIRVLSLALLAGGTATAVTLNSGSTAITPAFALPISGSLILPHNEHGWFETTAGAALTATTGTGATTSFLLTYVEVP